MTLQSTLLILLPVLTPFIGSSVAAILAQNKWPAWANDSIAWVVLLTFAGGDMWANSQFAGSWVTISADAVQAITLLSSGWLVKLNPWLAWLNFLHTNVFNLVPLFEDMSKPTLANPAPMHGPTAPVMPPSHSPVVPRMSIPIANPTNPAPMHGPTAPVMPPDNSPTVKLRDAQKSIGANYTGDATG